MESFSGVSNQEAYHKKSHRRPYQEPTQQNYLKEMRRGSKKVRVRLLERIWWITSNLDYCSTNIDANTNDPSNRELSPNLGDVKGQAAAA
jgi:hypothetical protein